LDFLTEAYFSCLRTAAEPKEFGDQVCQLPMDPDKIRNIFNCDFERNI
jgi:hypothetical protein